MTKKHKVMALDAGPQDRLEPEIAEYFRKCEEKLGFVPNVFRAYAFDNAKLKAFILMADDLMLGDSGLSKTEREMIAVAVSAINHCHYCLTSHGAALRQRGKDPELGELIAQNYRAADARPAPEGDARFCDQAHGGTRQDRGSGSGSAAQGGVQRSRHLGHRRRRQLLQYVEPHGGGSRHAAQYGVSLLGAGAQRRGAARRAQAPAGACARRDIGLTATPIRPRRIGQLQVRA